MLRSGLALFLTGSLATGCLVSFDGYQRLGTGGTGNDATSAGTDASGGKASGGSKGNGGKASGGSSNGGTGDTIGGEGGTDATGGASAGGSGGTAAGGKAGNGSGGKAGNGSGGTTSAGAGGSTAGTSGAGSGGSGAKTCPDNLEGPPMVDIPKPGGGIYCMDRTEVTNGDYAAFLAAVVPTSGQINECTWNDSYQPDTTLACTAAQGAYDPVAKPRVPVSCIDWCDAKRYCGWAGKRLCGAINGGSNPPGSYIDPNASQWYRACSKAGSLKFPYGNSYQPTYCVGLDNSGTHPSQVASAPACIGGYPGLYDLSGNVAEWEDSCSAVAGANDNCLTRGGSIQSVESVAPSLLCNDATINDATPMPATAKRNSKDELVGFRCCYDP